MINENSFKYTVLIDCGHGIDTPGKSSPSLKGVVSKDSFNEDFIKDDKFKEYAFARKMRNEAIPIFKAFGIKPIIINPEEEDISLAERCKRINKYVKEEPNCVMVSIHVNAAGNGDWMLGRGFSVWTTKGATVSDKLGECIYDSADQYLTKDAMFIESYANETKQKMIRTDMTDGDRDCEANFYVTKNSNCPAVLIENLFMDNKEDVQLLSDRHCFYMLLSVMVFGVNNYFKKYKGKK
jgi:N-acetylmuramoyl-L-alanine amidase